MSYKRITIGSGTPVTDEVIDYLKNTNMPAVRAMGATDCDIVQTGPDTVVLYVSLIQRSTPPLVSTAGLL